LTTKREMVRAVVITLVAGTARVVRAVVAAAAVVVVVVVQEVVDQGTAARWPAAETDCPAMAAVADYQVVEVCRVVLAPARRELVAAGCRVV
jgi:hypothetical protein